MKKIIYLILIIIMIFLIVIGIKYINKKGEIDKYNDICDNYDLYITLDNNTLNNLVYCSDDINTLYQEININIIKEENGQREILDTLSYEGTLIKIDDYLNDFNLDIECSDNLFLEVTAKDVNLNVDMYNIYLVCKG